ncbi:hypothetical protein MNBD_GAMMA11-638 [hydrothermal vent metagenome]|uniref:Uncharacterized protein n=1 Tax=hydrothermal vent metagenome TaxID=652676 RepID=A0A3B0WS60_9ZZZZ
MKTTLYTCPRKIQRALTGLCLMLSASAVHASSASLSAAPSPLNIDDIFSLDFALDLSDTNTTGGAIDISWDAGVIQFNNNFSFDTGTIDSNIRDTGFDVIDFQQPGLLSIGLGNFSGMSPSGLLGLLDFTVVGAGTTNISLADSAKWAGFFETTGGAAISLDYTASTVTTVPLPAPIGLMIAGLSLFGIRRSQRKNLTPG